MANNTQINCGCGATINSSVSELINSFDNLHGNPQHQLLLLQIKKDEIDVKKQLNEVKKEIAEVGRIKWGVLKPNGI